MCAQPVPERRHSRQANVQPPAIVPGASNPAQRTRLVAQHIKVMLEIQHMLAAPMTSLVAGNPPASMPDLHVQRMDARLYPGARRAGTE